MSSQSNFMYKDGSHGELRRAKESWIVKLLCQESESSLAEWFWLKEFHKIVVKLSEGVQSSLGPTGAEESTSKLTLIVLPGLSASLAIDLRPSFPATQSYSRSCSQHGNQLPPQPRDLSEKGRGSGTRVRQETRLGENWRRHSWITPSLGPERECLRRKL